MANHNPYELERVSIRLIKDAMTPMLSDRPLNSPGAVAKLLHNEIFADLDREMFAVVNLKTNMGFNSMKVLMDEMPPDNSEFGNLVPSSINICSMGTLSESVVHPREVLKSSILSNANAVMLIHNHPSGNLEPSREDIQVTDRLMQAYDLMGIPVMDHIILGPKEQYYSFYENAILPLPDNRYTTNLEDIHFSSQRVAESGSVLDKLNDAKQEVKRSDRTKNKRNSKKKIKEESL